MKLVKKKDYRLWQYLAQVFLEWEMFQTKFADQIKVHILRSITYFQESCSLWDWYGEARQATDDSMYDACTLQYYKHTHYN